MHSLVLALITASLGVDYLAHERMIPGMAGYLQEVLALCAILIVIFAGVRTRFANVRPGYWFAFAAVAVIVVCGVFVNDEGPGPVFAGMRTYLRAMPLFFLPAVCELTVRQLRQQMALVFLFALVQVPLALYQRMTKWAAGHMTGDFVTGTLQSSATLSVFLICVACVLSGLYMRKKLPLRWFLPLLVIVLVPTTVNETKATIGLLPLGLLATFIVASDRSRRLRNGVIAVTALSIFASIFIPVYDYYVKPRWGYGIVDFMMQPGRLESYLDRKHSGKGAAKAQPGKGEALVVPFETVSRQPIQLVFGYGIGNASDSALGEQFVGEQFRRFEPFRQSTAAVLMLEIGLLGFGLVLWLYYMIYRDARFVALRTKGMLGGLAAGWVGVVAVIGLSTFYTELMAFGSISFLFWYFSGLVVAERARLERAVVPRTVPASSAVRPGSDVRGAIA